MLNKQKGFISIIVLIAVLSASVVLLINGNTILNLLKDEIVDVNERIGFVEEETLKLGGSLTATRYGGTGTSTVGWGGLLRLTAGLWGTTTLLDADVPDDITVTGLTDLSINTLIVTTSTALNTLAVSGTSTFAGTSTFIAIPTLPSATATVGTQATNKNYVDEKINLRLGTLFSFTTTTGNIAWTSTTVNMFLSVVCQQNSVVPFVEINIGSTLNSSTTVCASSAPSNYQTSCYAFIPKNYYYSVIGTVCGNIFNTSMFKLSN